LGASLRQSARAGVAKSKAAAISRRVDFFMVQAPWMVGMDVDDDALTPVAYAANLGCVAGCPIRSSKAI
jgi:hypothetical protein